MTGLKDLHEVDKFVDCLKWHRIVESDAASANPCMPFKPEQAFFLRLLCKFSFQGHILVSDAEGDIDAGAELRLNAVPVVMTFGVDVAIERFRTCLCASLHFA